MAVNWDIIKGKWNQLKGDARMQWGKLTDDDLTAINGRREELEGKIQQHYGLPNSPGGGVVEVECLLVAHSRT